MRARARSKVNAKADGVFRRPFGAVIRLIGKVDW